MADRITVTELVNDIKSNLSQKSASRKDEIKVMQAMLNDTSYEVNIYGKDGAEGVYTPAKDFRNMCANIISKAAKISASEATNLVDKYEVTKSDATTMVDVSKEFINTYIHTNRKLPLGAREFSDVSISLKTVPESTRLYPTKVGVNDDGTDRYSKTPTTVPAHESVRVIAPCPVWVK